MSKIIVVIGAQWGDEGKGKIVDLLAEHFDIVARYQGGHNAGHSVQVGDQSFVLHLLPSGIVHRGKICVLGNGMVIDPKAFFEEADRLMDQGIEVSPERVKISSRAHLILPYHRALDHTSEERLGNEKVGTTLRGIGPAYEDKAGRRGIRTADALVPDVLRSRIERNLEDANRIIEAYGGEKLDADEIFKEMSRLTERLGAFIGDTTHYLNVAAAEGRSILLEGAQATLLDVDHGTYPFVTSSSAPPPEARLSVPGLAPNRLTGVLGIVRTYTTRVGEGPFPTEMLEGEAELGQTDSRAWPRIWRLDRSAASLWLVRRIRHALRRGDQWLHFGGAHQARRARRARRDKSLHWYTSWTGASVNRSRPSLRICVASNRSTQLCRAGRRSTVGTTEMNSLPANARRYVEFLSEQDWRRNRTRLHRP